MKILIHSNAPWSPSAYGQQTALWAPRFASLGHEVAVSAFHGLSATRTEWQGIPVFGGGMELYGADVVAGHAREWRADVVLTLMDIWALGPRALKGLPAPACWLPVDCSPLSVMDQATLEQSGAVPIAMSEHGRRELAAAGFAPLYAPHGIDTGVFTPVEEAQKRRLRAEARIPEDAFVIGINAANLDGVRKGFPEQFAAFSLFRQEHPEALLMVHALAAGTVAGTDLNMLAKRTGIADAIAWSSPYRYAAGSYAPADMADWYRMLDVFSGAAWAEGFGLPPLEAQSCGVPVVVTDFSAMPQLCGSGWKVPGDLFWNPRHAAWWCKPRIAEIAAAYKAAHAGEGDPVAARAFAETYDADRVLKEHWAGVLAGLEARL